MQTLIKPEKFCGRTFSMDELMMIREVVSTCNGLSRAELAHTVCELLDWKRPRGGLKSRECKDLLERLANKGILELPEKRKSRDYGPQKFKKKAIDSTPYSSLFGSVEQFLPFDIQRVKSLEQRVLFRDLLSQYHYLGYAMPFGARLQYLIHVTRPQREVVGCIQFSSAAWRMKARDQWIDWDDERRSEALQQVVNNSRFLVLATIRNLASSMLSSSLDRLRIDWEKQYGVTPLLVETLVDQKRYHGGCYRAANWIELGKTSGRGRMDKTHKRHGAEVKTVLVYPLAKNARHSLRDGR